jgi:hypothetical protein
LVHQAAYLTVAVLPLIASCFSLSCFDHLSSRQQ